MKIKRRKIPAYRRALSYIFERISKKLHNRKIVLFCSVVAVLVVFVLGTFSGFIFSFFLGSLHPAWAPDVKGTLDNLGISSFITKNYWNTQGGSGTGEIVKIIQIVLHPLNYIEGVTSQPEKLYIDIKFKDYQRIAYTREQALETGFLISSDDDYVPATVTVDGETYRVKMRLKGDLKDHWIDDKKWSFMVKMRDNRTLFGMRRFALQHPRASLYLDDWHYLKFLSHYGLMGLRINFVELIVNGDNLGIYALKEHYDKRVMEHNELREGPILKMDDYIWLHYYGSPLFDSPLGDYNDIYYTSDLEAYGEAKLMGDEALREQFEKARNLLESFRQGKMSTHEVFDVEKLARFMAVNGLFGSSHPADYANIRLYYNPVTSHLEPIGSDNAIQPVSDFTDRHSHIRGFAGLYRKTGISPVDPGEEVQWLDRVFADEVFFREYIAAMEEISEPAVLDAFFDSISEEAEGEEQILHRSYPAYTFSKQQILYENQQLIKEILNPPRLVKAHFAGSDDGTLRLQVTNLYDLPVEILDVTYNGTVMLRPIGEVLLQPKPQSGPVAIQTVAFSIPEHITWDNSMVADMVVNHRILGASTTLNRTIFPWALLDEDFLDGDLMRQQPNAESFTFLTIDDGAKVILLQRGDWNLERSIIIPPGYTVLCTGGTTLDLTGGATILSYSPFICSGTEDDPVRFVSSDSTGQGLTVLNAEGTSEFDYVVFENLSAPSQGGWTLTGAVTFYESPVEFRHCLFRNGRAEDGLNAIRTDVTMEGCLFERSLSDCFDWDFVKGTVKDTSFIGCGNDGLDISGSVADMANIITKVGDKGISIGENSKATLKGITVEGGLIGIASKDLSEVTAEDVRISGSRYGIAAYQKKPEFGPGILSARNVMMEDVQQELIVEMVSSVSIDGTVTEGWDTNINGKLYPEE